MPSRSDALGSTLPLGFGGCPGLEMPLGFDGCPGLSPLRIGMSGEASILVGRRRLIAYVVEPARALRERAFVE